MNLTESWNFFQFAKRLQEAPWFLARILEQFQISFSKYIPSPRKYATHGMANNRRIWLGGQQRGTAATAS